MTKYKEIVCDYCNNKGNAPFTNKGEYEQNLQLPIHFGSEIRRLIINFPKDKIMCTECRILHLGKISRGLKIQSKQNLVIGGKNNGD